MEKKTMKNKIIDLDELVWMIFEPNNGPGQSATLFFIPQLGEFLSDEEIEESSVKYNESEMIGIQFFDTSIIVKQYIGWLKYTNDEHYDDIKGFLEREDDFVYEFVSMLEEYGLDKNWYRYYCYNLYALAENWCCSNNIKYKKKKENNVDKLVNDFFE